MDKENQTEQFFDKLLLPRIFCTFRLALQPSKIALALGAIAIICLSGWLMDFSNTVCVVPGSQRQIRNFIVERPAVTELDFYLSDPVKFEYNIAEIKATGARQGVFTTLWSFARNKFNGVLNALFSFNFKAAAINIGQYAQALEWAFKYHTVYCIIFTVIKLSVLAVFGGAICRMAALQYARGEKPGMFGALAFSTKRFTSFFAAPLVPVLLVLGVGFFIFIVGLLTNVPFIGDIAAGIFIPLILIAAAVAAALIIGGAAGFNLMFPAICYDGSDCFDAMSRAFSYVYARPWRMAFYTLIAAFYGAVCYLAVRLYVFLTLFTARLFLQAGIWTKNESGMVNKLDVLWPQPTYLSLIGEPLESPTGFSEYTGALLIYLFSLLAIGLLIAFLISFYFSANTIIYAALRSKVDQTALEDVYTEEVR